MKFIFAFLATLFLAAPAWAVDVMMGANGNLVFEPAEVTIAAGESVHFVNNMLPPHNVVVEDHPEISHEGLAMMPGEEIDVTFAQAQRSPRQKPGESSSRTRTTGQNRRRSESVRGHYHRRKLVGGN